MKEAFEKLKRDVMDFPDGKITFICPVQVRRTPHHHLFTCYEICADVQQGVWLRDEDGKWHQLEPDDDNSLLIINSLQQRVKFIQHENRRPLQTRY